MSNQLTNIMGVQSYCFRAFKEHSDVIKCVKDSGMDKIELCAVHLDLQKDNAAEILNIYQSAGVSVSAYGVNGFNEDEAAGRKVFEFAKLAGFNGISADFRSEGAIEVVEGLCKEYGIKAAVHNHGRKHKLGPVWALEALFEKTSENIGLCLDTAWMIDSGENPVDVAEKFRDRLYGLHIKDFIFNKAGKPEDVVIGQGNLDLPALVSLLTQTNFDGFVTLEYEGDLENPVPATKQCVEAFKAACSEAG